MLDREVRRGLATANDVVGAWSELITDKAALARALEAHAPGQFSARELNQAHDWCAAQTALVLLELEQAQEAATRSQEKGEKSPNEKPGTAQAA